jgi:hypothetical protein
VNEETWHGSTSGYNYHRCRCARCCEANRLACRSVRERHYAERVEVDGRPIHPRCAGDASSYNNLGCRCVACTEAHSIRLALLRAS